MICVKNSNEIAMDRQLLVSLVTEHLDNAPGYFPPHTHTHLNRGIYMLLYKNKTHPSSFTVTQFYPASWFAIVLG